jgi:hypothetical protein
MSFFIFFERHQQEICCAYINIGEAKHNKTFTEKQKTTTLTTVGEINLGLPLSRRHNNDRKKTPSASYRC